MQWEHFAPDLQSFTVWGKGANGKGHKERVVPCDNAICQAIIAKYKGKAEDIPFVSRFNIFPKQLQRLCEKIARKAGIRRFGPHALRHYYVTTMIAAGVPLKVVSMIIAHANTAITEQVYTHLKRTHIMGWSHMLNDVDKKVTIAPNTMK
jgi:integrase